jgi:hypothetical protein
MGMSVEEFHRAVQDGAAPLPVPGTEGRRWSVYWIRAVVAIRAEGAPLRRETIEEAA